MKKIMIFLGVALLFTPFNLLKANEDITGLTIDFKNYTDISKDGLYDSEEYFLPGTSIHGRFKYNDVNFFKEKYSKYINNIPNEEKNKYDIILSYKAPNGTCFNKNNVFSIKLPEGKIKRDFGYFRTEIRNINGWLQDSYTFNINNYNNSTNIFEYSIDNGVTWINYENELNFRNNISTNDCITDMRIKNPTTTSYFRVYDKATIKENNHFIYRYTYDIPADYKGDTLTETINLKLINNQTGTVSEKNFTNTLKKYQSERICKPGKLKFIVKEIPLPKEGTLKVEYYDKETLEKISEDRVKKGKIDDIYTSEKIEISDYTYDSVEGEEIGVFTEDEKVVKYFYTKVKKDSSVLVKYYDKETLEEISEEKLKTGKVGEDYTSEKIEIADYTYDSVEGEETGKFIEGEKIVRYFYTKVKTVVTPKEENIVLGSAPSIPNIEKDSRVITTENTVKETPKITNEKEKEIIKEALKIEEPIKEEKISFEPVSPIEITNEEIYLPKVLPKTGAEHWLILLFISFIMSHFILNVKGRNS